MKVMRYKKTLFEAAEEKFPKFESGTGGSTFGHGGGRMAFEQKLEQLT
jgi:hypothetical protein